MNTQCIFFQQFFTLSETSCKTLFQSYKLLSRNNFFIFFNMSPSKVFFLNLFFYFVSNLQTKSLGIHFQNFFWNISQLLSKVLFKTMISKALTTIPSQFLNMTHTHEIKYSTECTKFNDLNLCAAVSCSLAHYSSITLNAVKLSKNIHGTNKFHLKIELAKPLRMHFVSLALISSL